MMRILSYASAMVGVFLACAVLAIGAGTVRPAAAKHVGAHQCGVSSGKFARICRPGSDRKCLDAVKRGVPGFTVKLCAQRKVACSACLGNIRTCISRIGHWPRVTHSCARCKARFDRCIKRRYPKLP